MKTFFSNLAEAFVNSIQDGAFSTAKGAAYSLILAFFPTLMLLSEVLVGTRTTAALAREITNALERVMPPTSRGLALQYFSGPSQHYSFGLIFTALGIALFAGTGVTGSFIEGFRAAYRMKFDWSIWHEEGLALGLVFMAGTPMLAATALVVFGQQVQSWMLQQTTYPLVVLLAWSALSWILAITTGTLVLGILYYLSPNCEDHFWRVLPGAFLATVGWLLASAGFAWYVKNLAVYSKIYGNLGTLIALMIWMYLGALIILFGCQFNAVRERKRRGE
jgi:membrane protein